MIKFYVRLMFYLSIVALSSIAKGNDRFTAKPDDVPFPSGSCTDKCHVNYLAYYTVYEGEIFRHKSHAPHQGVECHQCHNNDTVHTKTHGGLTIQKKDCWICHHNKEHETATRSFPKNQEIAVYKMDCLPCHTEVQDYLKGEIQGMGIKMPDWMSSAVSCTNCHKPELNGFSFKAVRNHCIECHNNDYGLLHDAWKETLDKEIKQFSGNGIGTQDTRNLLRLVQSYGMHNFRLSQKLLKSMDIVREKPKHGDDAF